MRHILEYGSSLIIRSVRGPCPEYPSFRPSLPSPAVLVVEQVKNKMFPCLTRNFPNLFSHHQITFLRRMNGAP